MVGKLYSPEVFEGTKNLDNPDRKIIKVTRSTVKMSKHDGDNYWQVCLDPG